MNNLTSDAIEVVNRNALVTVALNQGYNAYIRNGPTSLFAALDIATGAVIGKCYRGHRATEFLDFLKQIDAAMPEGPEVHLVMDNYATHKMPRIKA